MTVTYDAVEVFTPNDVPKLTYVYRKEHDLEAQLKASLRTPGQIISLSGPSKSGKTSLIKRMVGAEALITVSGGSIKSADQLWERVLNWMESPTEVSQKTGTVLTTQVSGKVSGSIGLPALGKTALELAGAASKADAADTTTKIVRSGIDQVVREISGSDFVVFIDDFHYMTADVQKDVARQIKEAAEKGVIICTASVPHRSDDVVRSNTELRGRVRAIDFSYWANEEIQEIGVLGFHALGADISRETITRLANESFGSPQLMQAICLQACYQLDIDGTKVPPVEYYVNEQSIRKILEHTSSTASFSKVLDAMHAGPKLRGQERRLYQFQDGSEGDVYRCVLLALTADPPALTLRYDEVLERTKAACKTGAPVGSSVSQALEKVCEIASDLDAANIIEWSEEVLAISDPYFLFYARCSSKLSKLKSPGT